MTKTEMDTMLNEATQMLVKALDAHVAREKAKVAAAFTLERDSLNARMDKMFAELAPGKD